MVIGMTTQREDPRQHGRARLFGTRGTTLIEVLVATVVLVSGLLGMAQLFLLAAATNSAARHTTVTAILAAQKVEQLRGLTWGFDTQGLPISDGDLQPSPSDTLRRDVGGYVDHVDLDGRTVGTSESPPSAAYYTRRWSIEPLSATPGTLIIRVVVGRTHHRRLLSPSAADAKLLTIRTRR
jgi:type II secretory pathway pseudopilin PulG